MQNVNPYYKKIKREKKSFSILYATSSVIFKFSASMDFAYQSEKNVDGLTLSRNVNVSILHRREAVGLFRGIRVVVLCLYALGCRHYVSLLC